MSETSQFHGTTIVCVRRDKKVVIGGDGQVTFGTTVWKHGSKKVRVMGGGKVLAGFAGGAADALALLDRFEAKLAEFKDNLPRAAVELTKDWRTDRVLRRLEAMLAVADAKHAFILSGSGEVVEPDDGLLAIGSGGPYALAASRALLANTKMSARQVVEESLRIAAEICIYTNTTVSIEELDSEV